MEVILFLALLAIACMLAAPFVCALWMLGHLLKGAGWLARTLAWAVFAMVTLPFEVWMTERFDKE